MAGQNEPDKLISCSKGIGIGRLFKIKEHIINNTVQEDVEDRILKLKKAISEYKKYNESLCEKASRSLSEEDVNIIRSHVIIAEDPEINELFEKFIRAGKSAEKSVEDVCNLFAEMFVASDDVQMAQKHSDVIDVRDSLISILMGENNDSFSFQPGTVIYGKTVVPSLVSKLEDSGVVGIISESGNETSHSAILARALHIPFVSGFTRSMETEDDGIEVIVDAVNSKVILSPDAECRERYEKIKSDYDLRISELVSYKGKQTFYPEGDKFSILCNISGLSDIRRVLENDGDGVGLFRTEFIFMNRTEAPTESEQYYIYKKAACDLKGKDLVIRIFDAGGDKDIPYLHFPKEENPFLGLRGIRFGLRNRDILKTQIRAILRAAVSGNVKLMIPMVTDASELREFREIVRETEIKLENEGTTYKKGIEIGCMIETPSAAIMADAIAKEADFFAIGTNDLIQYTMCADRGNTSVSYLFRPYYPAVLRLIAMVSKAAEKNGIPVCVCGEAASDKRLLPFFAGLRIGSISVDSGNVLKMRKAFLKMGEDDFSGHEKKITEMESEGEILEYLMSL